MKRWFGLGAAALAVSCGAAWHTAAAPASPGSAAPETRPAKPAEKPMEPPFDPRSPEAALARAGNRLGFELVREALARDGEKNLFLSPASISLALSMTYNGAAGATREGMAKTLHLGEAVSQREALNAAWEGILSTLRQPDPRVELSLANSLWLRKSVPFRPDFVDRNRDSYQAEAHNVDFQDRGTLPRINGWVSDKTHGKVPRILQPPDLADPNLVLILLNALYFKGEWAARFDPALTEEGPFTLAGGGTKKLPFMTRKGKYAASLGPEYSAVRLPYGGGRLAMYLVVPPPGRPVTELAKGMTPAKWDQLKSRLRETEVTVRLPRFKLEYERDLGELLQELGMRLAFTPQADFSGIAVSGDPIWISKVRHKTAVEVSEAGTEAAAATAVLMIRGLTPRISADRPFFCAIEDSKTGAMLFTGVVFEP